MNKKLKILSAALLISSAGVLSAMEDPAAVAPAHLAAHAYPVIEDNRYYLIA
jgi:hypothetical protein